MYNCTFGKSNNLKINMHDERKLHVCTTCSVITTCGNFCILDWIKSDGEAQPVDCRFFRYIGTCCGSASRISYGDISLEAFGSV